MGIELRALVTNRFCEELVPITFMTPGLIVLVWETFGGSIGLICVYHETCFVLKGKWPQELQRHLLDFSFSSPVASQPVL